MKKHTIFLGTTLIALFALFALVLASPAKDTKPMSSKSYPLKAYIVSGVKLESVGKSVTIVHKGQDVKFCCKAGIKKFTKDPKKYLVKLAAEPAQRLEHTKDSLEVSIFLSSSWFTSWWLRVR